MNGESKWMVGFRSEEAGRLIERFYLVENAATGAEACRTAIRMATCASTGAGNAGFGPDIRRVQVQRVAPDLLGNFSLSLPLVDEMEIFNSAAVSPAEVAP